MTISRGDSQHTYAWKRRILKSVTETLLKKTLNTTLSYKMLAEKRLKK